MHCSLRCLLADWYVFDGQPVHTKSAVLLCFALTNSPGLQVEIDKHSRLVVAVFAFASYSELKSHSLALAQMRSVLVVGASVSKLVVGHVCAVVHVVSRWLADDWNVPRLISVFPAQAVHVRIAVVEPVNRVPLPHTGCSLHAVVRCPVASW